MHSADFSTKGRINSPAPNLSPTIFIAGKRSSFNVSDDALVADDNVSEYTNNSGMAMDFTAQGFKVRGTNSFFNTSGSTYVYMAFAESPFTNSSGVPNNAR